ncbi:MAG TPA: BtpA/SgcQ family protein, partial [Acidimicrobiia bacterium]|nr:BtpA/SgcQ family protein [Acidimicrobiia bacterium]
MVHLGALPGSPRFAGDLDGVIAAAVGDARTLIDAGFDAVLV